jgi:hypothetical protein
MTIDRWLAIAGIILSLVFGLGAIFFAPKIRQRRQRLNQKTGPQGVSLQAGRDVKIGRDE